MIPGSQQISPGTKTHFRGGTPSIEQFNCIASIRHLLRIDLKVTTSFISDTHDLRQDTQRILVDIDNLFFFFLISSSYASSVLTSELINNWRCYHFPHAQVCTIFSVGRSGSNQLCAFVVETNNEHIIIVPGPDLRTARGRFLCRLCITFQSSTFSD
jgi:hypothetical protein